MSAAPARRRRLLLLLLLFLLGRARAALGQLSFEPIEPDRYPCLELACEALRLGGNASVVLNAANEVAVDAFLAGRIRFTAIAPVIGNALEKCPAGEATDLEAILQADAMARACAQESLAHYSEVPA